MQGAGQSGKDTSARPDTHASRAARAAARERHVLNQAGIPATACSAACQCAADQTSVLHDSSNSVLGRLLSSLQRPHLQIVQCLQQHLSWATVGYST